MSSPLPSRPRARRAAALAAAGAAALLVAASPAAARIVPGSSIAGVRLGAGVQDVRDRLGPPTRITHPASEITGNLTVYAYRGLTVTFGPGDPGDAKVISVSSGRRAERTAAGIGVGSARSALRRAYPRLRCAAVGRRSVCTLGTLRPGARVTTFRISAGHRVSRVEVGLVID
ncbi:hypothetical protein [Patulibacter defluvii]|uniref:hypothetical protein n=1 Tax=Patulibacter defluvii TaxID=3095358 RepID=UPI002A755837|nr:hypothetical protein [Patulibacter sp. DM4]